MSEPNGVPRRVEYSGKVLRQLKKLAQEARDQGRGPAFLAALKVIEQGLRGRPLPPEDHPNVFGEPCFRLPALGLLMCKQAVSPLVVHFSVSEQVQIAQGNAFVGVYVNRFFLMSPQ
jgi:hypothetical protein